MRPGLDHKMILKPQLTGVKPVHGGQLWSDYPTSCDGLFKSESISFHEKAVYI